MTQDLEIYLTSCQVGITASSIAVGIVAEPALAALFEPYFAGTALASIGAGALLAFAIINLVHLTHGEQTPTYLGVERSKFVCRYGARPLYWFAWLISPIMRIGDGVAKATLKLFGIEMTGAWLETEEQVIESRADLRNRLDSLLDEGNVPEERQEEVLNALAIDEMAVAEVEENLSRMRATPHTRLPPVGEGLTDLRGIVYTPSVLTHVAALEGGRTHVRGPRRAPDDARGGDERQRRLRPVPGPGPGTRGGARGRRGRRGCDCDRRARGRDGRTRGPAGSGVRITRRPNGVARVTAHSSSDS
jgi:CBS domain containing-hemolysin-like protein